MVSANTPEFNKVLHTPLAEIDPKVQNIVDKETWRQFFGLESSRSRCVINSTSRAATMEANGSILTHKYSEGLPNVRYLSGKVCVYVDELEFLCQKRAIQTFHLESGKWGANVQPYSGSTTKWVIRLYATLELTGNVCGRELAMYPR